MRDRAELLAGMEKNEDTVISAEVMDAVEAGDAARLEALIDAGADIRSYPDGTDFLDEFTDAGGYPLEPRFVECINLIGRVRYGKPFEEALAREAAEKEK